MSDKPKNDWLNDDVLDALIKQGIEQQINDEMDYYQKIAEEQGLSPSKKLDQKIKAVDFQYRHKKRRRIAFKWVAAVILVILCTHFTLYFSVEAYRLPFQQLFFSIVGEGSEITVSQADENKNTVSPEEQCPFELWLPQGYNLVLGDENNNEKSMYYTWEDTKGNKISLLINYHEKTEGAVDLHNSLLVDIDDNTQLNEILINSLPGYQVTKSLTEEKVCQIIWSDNDYIFKLQGNYGSVGSENICKEIYEIAESLRKKE